MVRGPRAGLDLLGTLDADERLAGHHRLDAVRAHLLEMAGDRNAARAMYRTAARRATSIPEQRYLESRAARLAEDEASAAPTMGGRNVTGRRPHAKGKLLGHDPTPG
jgi:predicted RNA polymerase sigma factor